MSLWGRIKAVFTGYEKPEEAPIDKVMAVWVQVDREQPHAGLANFSDDLVCPFSQGIRIQGISLLDARISFCGKMVNWGAIGFDFTTLETNPESFRKMIW